VPSIDGSSQNNFVVNLWQKINFLSRIIVGRLSYLSQSSRKSLTSLVTASKPKAALNIFMLPVSTK